jgi:hypothetical protein
VLNFKDILPLPFALTWLDKFANCTLTERKITNEAPPDFSEVLAASQLLTCDNYTPIVISNGLLIKPPILSSQPNSALNAGNI